MLDYSKSFIETQFPVSKISKEIYKEKTAGGGQTLTGLGKWWGRTSLILVRATLLGTLMPVSDDHLKDMDVFLKILTMDDNGLWLRKSKNIPTADIVLILNQLEKEKYFDMFPETDMFILKKTLSNYEKQYLQKLAFNRLSYGDKLKYCDRPENYELTDKVVWAEINKHLETTANNLQELIEQLGIKRFGHRPKVGDAFAGGGSIPFESARIGADVYASDLNPTATMLTWAALNIAGVNDDEVYKLKDFQHNVFTIVEKQVSEWKIERNESGHKADAYFYCNETICPECGYKVPLSTSWIISKKSKTIAILEDNGVDGYDIKIVNGAKNNEIENAEKMISIKNRRSIFHCPHCLQKTPISSIRGDKKNEKNETLHGLRLWGQDELIPRKSDIFQERLYAICYSFDNEKYYTSPTDEDLNRELKVIEILRKQFNEWQEKGFIPSNKFESNKVTCESYRTRGWQYWHQLFNPRQLLIIGLFLKTINEIANSQKEMVTGLLGINKIIEMNSKDCIWNNETEFQTLALSTQVINPQYNYATIGLLSLSNTWDISIKNKKIQSLNTVNTLDARLVNNKNDIWLTKPPYYDYLNYDELTEYFLSWNKELLKKTFPEWSININNILTIKITDDNFRKSIVNIYKNLAINMHDNGYQIIIITPKDIDNWVNLSIDLWSTGLQVIAAWNMGVNLFNQTKGNLLLVLKKRVGIKMAFQDELYDEIKKEVDTTLNLMCNLDINNDSFFSYSDYLLACYTSCIKVLTSYDEIDAMNLQYWLNDDNVEGINNPIKEIISKLIDVAHQRFIPKEFDVSCWKDLLLVEKFYICVIEMEINKKNSIDNYIGVSRWLGFSNYKNVFFEGCTNSLNLKTPMAFNTESSIHNELKDSLLLYIFTAIKLMKNSNSTFESLKYLQRIYNEKNLFNQKKQIIIEILLFISSTEYYEHMNNWNETCCYSKILKEALINCNFEIKHLESNKSLVKNKDMFGDKYPELAKEWHPTKNGELTPYNILQSNNVKVWWKCEHGHEWVFGAYSRVTKKNKCKVCKTSFGANYPELVKEWHPIKNGNLNPYNINLNSDSIFFWQCEHGNEWQSTIGERVRQIKCMCTFKSETKQFESQSEINKMTISYLKLDNRSYNALRSKGILTIGDLNNFILSYGENWDCRVQNLGASSKLKIENSLKNLSLLDGFESDITLKIETKQFKSQMEINELNISYLKLDNRSYNALRNKGILTIGDLINFILKNGKFWSFHIRNLGTYSQSKIDNRLKTLSLIDGVEPDITFKINNEQDNIQSEINELSISFLDLDNSEYNTLMRNGISTIGELNSFIIKNGENWNVYIENLEVNTKLKIENSLKKLLLIFQ